MNRFVWCCVVWCCMVWCCVVWCCVVWCFAVEYNVVENAMKRQIRYYNNKYDFDRDIIITPLPYGLHYTMKNIKK